MRSWNNWKKESWFPYTVAACVGVAFYMILNNLDFFGGVLSSIITIVKPLLYALILAYLIDPIARYYNRKFFSKMKNPRMGRNTAVILAVVTVLIGFGLLCAGFFPPLISSISNLFNTLMSYINRLDSSAGDLDSILPSQITQFLPDISISGTLLDKASEFITENLGNIAYKSASIGSAVANLVISFILAIYYMLDKERLIRIGRAAFRWVLKEKKYNSFMEFYNRSDGIMLRYIKVSLFETLIVGVANAIFMAIFGMPYILLVSIIVGITNLVPVFGPVIGAVLGGFMIVLVDPLDALIFLIFVIVLQTIDGYVLKPKLFGESLGVSPLLILVMIVVGGRIMGMVGILLAIPFAAILQFVVDDMVQKKKKSPKKTGKTETLKEDELKSAEKAESVKSGDSETTETKETKTQEPDDNQIKES